MDVSGRTTQEIKSSSCRGAEVAEIKFFILLSVEGPRLNGGMTDLI